MPQGENDRPQHPPRWPRRWPPANSPGSRRPSGSVRWHRIASARALPAPAPPRRWGRDSAVRGGHRRRSPAPVRPRRARGSAARGCAPSRAKAPAPERWPAGKRRPDGAPRYFGAGRRAGHGAGQRLLSGANPAAARGGPTLPPLTGRAGCGAGVMPSEAWASRVQGHPFGANEIPTLRSGRQVLCEAV